MLTLFSSPASRTGSAPRKGRIKMIRYAAVALALLALVGCRGEREPDWAVEPPVEAPQTYQWTPLAYCPAVEYVYAGEWGKHGSGKGEFQYPEYIAVAPDGTVYVADSMVTDIEDRIRIQYFDPSGTYLGEWGGSVADIAVAPDGTVYVNDPWTAIKCFTRTGSLLGERRISRREYGEDLPEGLAVAPNGNVYVACDGNGRIKYYTPGLKFLGGWGSEGDADGQFHTPGAVAVAPNGWVYVNDRGNRRIQYFTPNGSFVGQKRFLYKPFHAPVDVAVAPNGHLDGEVLGTWGHKGSGDGEFRGMSGIAVGPKGDVYVVDYVNDCVQRFKAVRRRRLAARRSLRRRHLQLPNPILHRRRLVPRRVEPERVALRTLVDTHPSAPRAGERRRSPERRRLRAPHLGNLGAVFTFHGDGLILGNTLLSRGAEPRTLPLRLRRRRA
jgi:sugar lactone lactonase YvrE